MLLFWSYPTKFSSQHSRQVAHYSCGELQDQGSDVIFWPPWAPAHTWHTQGFWSCWAVPSWLRNGLGRAAVLRALQLAQAQASRPAPSSLYTGHLVL